MILNQRIYIFFTVWIFLTSQVVANTYASSAPLLACPEIELPSVTGKKASFRYIDAGCNDRITIRPSFGVSGGSISGYTVQSIPYNPPFAFNQGTSIFIDKDDVWGNVVNLPFKFCFFENTYSKAVVGANGLISFNTSVANEPSGWCTANLPNIPSTQYINTNGYNWANAIYGVFEDIDPRQIALQHSDGSIKYGILGDYPCRTLTVSWYKVPLFGSERSSCWNSYQIVLYEGTNIIDVYVLHRARTSWNNGHGIIGLQNKSGTKGITAPNRNNLNAWTADKEAWRFTPISTPQYTITYYRGQGVNGDVIGTGEQITIDPTQENYITVQLLYTAANGSSFDLRDTALIIHTEHPVTETYKEICQGQSYEWYGQRYSQTGTYEHMASSSSECGTSRCILHLVVDSGLHQLETIAICDGETYPWHNKTYSQSGIYYDQHKSIAGCDSTYILNLTKHPSFHFVEDVHRCQGESYTWRGHTYSMTGIYQDKYRTIHGCDSIYELRFTIHTPYLIREQAAICPDEIYRWRGHSYYSAGIYYDSLLSVDGCDSVYQLTLRNSRTYLFEDSQTICQGEKYVWQGNHLTQTGTYYKQWKSVDDCDSTYILHLTVSPTYLFIKEDGLINNQTYMWRGNTYTTSGQYYDSYLTKDGCDSVYQLNLLPIRNKFYSYPPRYICEGQSLQWREKKYTETGIYYDSLKCTVPGADGRYADSVFQLVLFVQQPFYHSDTIVICEGESYEWQKRTLTQSGIYDTSFLSLGLCDSTYVLHLIVGKKYFFPIQHTLCEGESFYWHGFNYTNSGVYTDAYHSIYGYDSIYQLTIDIASKYRIEEYDTICQGETYLWHGQSCTQTGWYYDSLFSQLGCDSVYALHLTVGEHYIFSEEQSFCAKDVFMWRKKSFSQPGTYDDSLHTIHGCDSIYRLTLTALQPFADTTRATICEGEQFIWRNHAYTTTDMYEERYVANNGCDSVYVLILTVLPTFFKSHTAYICDDQAYRWHNKTYTEEGQYRDTLTATNGCDSVCELNLFKASSFRQYESYNLCDNATYSWHNQTIRQAGKYVDHQYTSCQCDSVYELEVSLCSAYHHIDYDTICAGDTVIWHDSICTKDSIYYQWFTTQNGCDSTYELRLIVNPTYHFNETMYLCFGSTQIWHDIPIDQPGVYVDSLSASTQCDSIFTLSVLHSATHLIETFDTICLNESYIWHEKNIYEAGIYYDSAKTMNQCDSVSVLYLEVVELSQPILPLSHVCANESAVYIHFQPILSEPIPFVIEYDTLSVRNGFVDTAGILNGGYIQISLPISATGALIHPNHYGGKLILSGNACQQDHTYMFDLDVYYPASIVIQKFDDVLAILNENYNGGYIFSQYQWYAEGEPIDDATLPYFYGEGDLTAPYYQVMLTRATDGVSMMTCPIIPKPKTESTPMHTMPIVRPLSVSRQHPNVIVYNNQITDIVVYTISGACMATPNKSIPEGYEVVMPQQVGIYLLCFQYDGQRFCYKIQVQ